MNSQTVLYEGKSHNLLPFSFLDKVGGAINKHFGSFVDLGNQHPVIQQMYSDRENYAKRGIFLIKSKKDSEPAYALTTKEIDFLRKNYEKSQEIF